MHRPLTAFLLSASLALPALAQAPGFIALTMAGLGGTVALDTETRLPVRPRDARVEGGDLSLRATGTRGAVREVNLHVVAAAPGRRFPLGPAASLQITLGNERVLEPAAGQGFVELADFDAAHATGRFEATLPQGRIPLVIHGRFEASFAPPARTTMDRP